MGKKFDVVIGNPPYQSEAVREGGRGEPLYHLFMDAAYEIGRQAIIITPARFLSNAGQTPKAWNAKMLADEHLRVAYFEPDSGVLFPGLADTIKGGIVVTHRDSEQVLGPIGTFTRHPALNGILHKVDRPNGGSLMAAVSSKGAFRYTDKMFEDHPNASEMIPGGSSNMVVGFNNLPFLWRIDRPNDGHVYAIMHGLDSTKRASRFIRRDFVTGPKSFDKWKVAIAKVNGTGSTTDFFGLPLTNPFVLGPGVGVTLTFMTIGAFDSEAEANACLDYLKTKFARAMLGVLKVTQDNARGTWKHVPMQDFTSGSDIDWSKSIPEIDQQLYAKYGLDDDEIAFIEDHVKPMD
ncbi:restriction endonuclease [Ornithinimicrobium sp. CNJ-824]|uniref:Eco57I restriction-modification methylase domain-containing protein n=1 Tax=Ornithinimicrobium sp. CNJ-824 TaxID=1904966 RepID=UPI00095E1110|nr:Eco57I restriction-modification methylase domain-containing protein [Ornithinimicrobium sp. CNJ-824]OLT21084.1 restriction endonuclease [Ornithinimicrobium sp. CNJ-824]